MLTSRSSTCRNRATNLLASALIATCVAWLGIISYAQDHRGSAPASPNVDQAERPLTVDLLRFDGSKSQLAPNGEGIVSYKTTHLFKRGVTVIKPSDFDSKIELPTGYTLFNNMV